MNRPAETAGGLAASVTALALAVGASAQIVGVLGILAGALPSVVTFWVAHGGCQGVYERLRYGRRP